MRPVTAIMKDWVGKKCSSNNPSPESHNFMHRLKSFEFTSRTARSKNKLNAESRCLQAFRERHNTPAPADTPPWHPQNTRLASST
jgi:hypothetical protein